MLLSFRCRAVAVLAVAGVLGLLFLPAEHIHADADSGAQHRVVHRHIAPHHSAADHTPALDHEGPSHNVQWVSVSLASPHRTAHVVDRHFITPLFGSVERPLTIRAWVQTRFTSTHDPPWWAPHALRGPPLSL